MAVKGSGIIRIGEIELPDCLFTPELNYKLLKISHLTKRLSILCVNYLWFVSCAGKSDREDILNGTERDGIYYLRQGPYQGNATLVQESSEHQLWVRHRRLGHPSLSYLKFLFPSLTKNISGLDCESCVLAKSHKHSYLSSTSHNQEPLALFHTDVWASLLLIPPLIMLTL